MFKFTFNKIQYYLKFQWRKKGEITLEPEFIDFKDDECI